MSLKEEMVVKMQLLGIEAKRSLGQNFLISEHVVSEIIEHVERRAPPFVVEVGPGLGALTERLIERKWPRTIIELDRKFAEYWRQRGETVVEGDALQIDWKDLGLPNETLLLSNLPYQIGSRLVIDLSTNAPAIETMVLMFQREVAERLMAETRSKEYGFLSVVAQTFWSLNRIVDASGSDFYPPPNVLSRVVAFKRRKTEARLGADFVAFVKTAFQFRRKFMLKAFAADSAALKAVFQKLNVSEKVRAEELTAEDFQKIYLMKAYG
jgi:16S rRNA (adenine1518-N6/adenine1519-N6)-dimethyltransferase